jgi:hypothetical protein
MMFIQLILVASLIGFGVNSVIFLENMEENPEKFSDPF